MSQAFPHLFQPLDLRHKTLKPKFRWLYWTFLVVQVGLLVYWLWSPAEAE